MSPDKALSDHVADVLRELFEARGVSAYRVIKVTGMSPQRVYRWFRGEYDVPIDDLKVIATIFDVTAASLLADAETRLDAELALDGGPPPAVNPEVQAARDEWDAEQAARKTRR